MTLVVLDIGVGNTASMIWALERLGGRPVLSADRTTVADAERLVLPGVGAAGHAVRRLEALGLTDVLKQFDRPLLGVCLGMQLLLEGSDEGPARCLGRLPGRARRIEGAPQRPVPHMGWNQLRAIDRDDPLAEGLTNGDHVYFVHSYAAPVNAVTTAEADYGGGFSAMVGKGRVWGCQLHPERSGPIGARILRNFLDLPC